MSVFLLAIIALGSEGTATRTIVVEPGIEQIVLRVVAGGIQDVVNERLGAMSDLRLSSVFDTGERIRGMQIVLCIDGRERTGDTERQISEGQCESEWQGVAGVAQKEIRGISDDWSEAGNSGNLERIAPTDVALSIDGQPRTGVIAWLAAASRVARYTVRDGLPSSLAESRPAADTSSIKYAYRLRLRGYDIRRSTRIEDDRVSLVTDVWGRIGPRGELYHVRLVLDAREMADGTRIRGTATGWSRIGDRCRLVRHIAEREISAAMGRELLAVVERGGRGLYASGDIHGIVSTFVEGLR